MKKYQFYIKNLECANCARRIEESLEKKENITNICVNFNTSTISYETDSFSKDDINKMIQDIEPGVFITEFEEEEKKEFHLSVLLVALFFGFIANFFDGNIKIFLFALSYVFLLYKIAFKAFKILIKNKTIDEFALITISALGAYFLGQELEGIMVVTLFTIGKILEAKALNNSRKSVKELLNIKEPYANKKEGNSIVKCEVEKVVVGDILVVKKGERIPVDGIVIKGHTKLDTSSLTGESEKQSIHVQDHVLSGSVNVG